MSKLDRRPKPNPVILTPMVMKIPYNLNVTVTPNEAAIDLVLLMDNGIRLSASKFGPNGYTSIMVTPDVPLGNGGTLVLDYPGYEHFERRIVTPFTAGDCDIPEIVLTRAYPFPAEVGKLIRDGKYIREVATGLVWQYRGVSQFLLFRRYRNGEDIRPNLSWMRMHGFNIARVFGPLDWPGLDDYRYVNDWDQLDEFFTLLQDYGLRCEWVPITSRPNSTDHKDLVVNSIKIAQKHSNVIIEVCNEPDKDNKCDPIGLMAGIDTSGVLTAYGKYVLDGTSWAENKIKDYLTYHSPRDYPKFSRNSKDLLEMRDALGCPVIDNEPIGVAEKNELGRRTTDISAILDHFAIAFLYSVGCCYHFQAGLEGRIPTEDELVQEECAGHLKDLFQFIPPEAQTGSYSNPGGGGLPFPVEWKESDSNVTHAYASILGDEAYIVNPQAAPNWEPIGKNGWQVVSKFDRAIIKCRRIQ